MEFEDRAITPQEPFASEPAQLGGCGKPVVIGCLVLLLLAVVGLVALMWKAQDLLEFAVGEYRAAVEASLPADLSAEERQRLAAAFDSALEAIRRGDLDPADARRLQSALSSPPRPGERLERAQVLELIEALEAIGDGAEDSAAPPGEAPAGPVALAAPVA